MSIRPVISGDRETIQKIVVRCDIFTAEEVQVALEVVDGSLAPASGDDYRTICAADADGAVVGFASYGRIPLTESSYDLYWIVVDPMFHGRGLGSQLLEHLEADVRSEGGAQLYVETSSQPGYGPAQDFYERRGFSRAAVFPDFYRPGDDKIVYVKRLYFERSRT